MSFSEGTINLIKECGDLRVAFYRYAHRETFEEYIEIAKILNDDENFTKLNLYNNLTNYNTHKIKQILSIFENNKNIKEIELSKCEIDTDSKQLLVKIITNNPDLHKIKLYSLNIEIDGELILGLKSCSKLKVFEIENTYITDDKLSEIVNLLREGQTLRDLYIHGDIEENSFEALNNLLNQNQLTTLTLINNKINDKKLIILADSIKNCTNLTNLSITFNNFGDNGVIALVEIIKDLKLKILDLSCNQIKNKGAEALGIVMENNSTIESIDLSGNEFTNEGTKILLPYLANNDNIQELIVYPQKDDDLELITLLDNLGYAIDLDKMKAYVEKLQHNKELKIKVVSSECQAVTNTSIDVDYSLSIEAIDKDSLDITGKIMDE